MKKIFKVILAVLIFLATVALSVYYISVNEIAVLEPKGMIGEKESELIITASLLMLIVVIPVFILTWVFAWRYREGNEKARHAPDWEHNYIAEYCWWGVPVVIIIILAVITWKSSHDLNPFKPIASDRPAIQIQVVALEWKWLFIYPDYGIATVNAIQFPERTPLSFTITSDAPMNSFWIPQLGGQIYAMPGMVSKLHLIARETGTFRGVSSNLSGRGFAGMTFKAISCTDEEFTQWVAQVRKSQGRLDLNAYNQLVIPSEYDRVKYYVLGEPDLFNQIVNKYMMPAM